MCYKVSQRGEGGLAEVLGNTKLYLFLTLYKDRVPYSSYFTKSPFSLSILLGLLYKKELTKPIIINNNGHVTI